MKKTYFGKIASLTLGVGFIYLLVGLSGCYEIAGAIVGDDYDNKAYWCDKKILIDGPETIFFDPCDPKDIACSFSISDGRAYNPDGIYYSSTTEASGDIEIATINPITIKANSLATGKGTITVTTTILTENTCKVEGEGFYQIISTKDIAVVAPKLDITSDVCLDPATGLGAGTLTAVDPSHPGAQKYIWTLLSGVADVSGIGNSPNCSVKNAKGDFTVSIQRVGSKCTTDPKNFDVKVPVCY